MGGHCRGDWGARRGFGLVSKTCRYEKAPPTDDFDFTQSKSVNGAVFLKSLREESDSLARPFHLAARMDGLAVQQLQHRGDALVQSPLVGREHKVGGLRSLVGS